MVRHRSVLARGRFRVPKMTARQTTQYYIVNRALDAATNFGVETASRERLLLLVGEITGAMRALRDTLGEK